MQKILNALAKQVANDMNVVLNDIDLHSVIAACNGSVQNVLIMWRILHDASPFNVVLNDIQAHFNRWAFLRLINLNA